jgi:hypothetical protein
MNKNVILQLISAVVLAVIALFLVDPMHAWMPDMPHEVILAGAVVVFGAIAIFVFSENKGDERDVAHRASAGRAAFFAGGTVLLVAIIAEGLSGLPDPWLVFALVAMVLGKVIMRLFASWYW